MSVLKFSPLTPATGAYFGPLICATRGNDQKENSPGKLRSTRSAFAFVEAEAGEKQAKLSARMKDFNLMFNGFLFIF
jgi:hypothetical protein